MLQSTTAKKLIISLSLIFITAQLFAAALGNRFVLAQLRTQADMTEWDPYPLTARDILSFLQQTTSIKSLPDRRIVSLSDPLLFQSPFVIYSGYGQFHFTAEEKQMLKRYLSGGGFMFVEDRAGEKGGSFDDAFRSLIKELFPDKSLAILPKEHPVYRSFYLLRSVGGRKLTNYYLEGLDIEGRTALIYSQNDVLGAWAKDLFGNFIHPCHPGGESQRWESQKLIVNLILYSLTGTYKTDPIHLPFIDEKLRR
jgi:hypothetical protein